MKKRITVIAGIAILAFALGLCGGSPTSQPAPKSSFQSSILHSTFLFNTGKHAYYSSHFLIVPQH
ncbi:MAG: hypothetical protein NVSMB27_14120 [Ktedonobacteraceae bacterium]